MERRLKDKVNETVVYSVSSTVAQNSEPNKFVDLIMQDQKRYLARARKGRDNQMILAEYRNLCYAYAMLLFWERVESGEKKASIGQTLKWLVARQGELETKLNNALNCQESEAAKPCENQEKDPLKIEPETSEPLETRNGM